MRTRAQADRDAALRRLTRINHSLAAAAVLGVAVVTDIVAHTASGHTVTTASSVAATGTGGVELLTGPGHSRRATGRSAQVRQGSAAAASSSGSDDQSGSSQSLQSSFAPSTVTASRSSSSSSSASSSNVAPASSVQPAVVAVSGGS